jgi:hypothetical protein
MTTTSQLGRGCDLQDKKHADRSFYVGQARWLLRDASIRWLTAGLPGAGSVLQSMLWSWMLETSTWFSVRWSACWRTWTTMKRSSA